MLVSSTYPRSAGTGVAGQPGCYLAKACAHCYKRKLKCDGISPTCSPCAKSSLDDCNVQDCLVWSDESHTRLRERVAWLEKSLSEALSVLSTGSTAAAAGRAEDLRTMETGFEFDWDLLGLNAGGSSRRDDKDPEERPSPPEGERAEIDRIAEEVGLLSLRGAGSYVGSGSGVTFARILFSAVRLYPTRAILADLPPHPADALSYDPEPATTSHAGLPPLSLAGTLLSLYIDRIHRWWPFCRLPDLEAALHAVYHPAVSRPSAYQRFVVFAVLSIGCDERSTCPPRLAGSETDLWTAQEYWNTALTFLAPTLGRKPSLDSLTALLLVCVRDLRSECIRGEGTNLWQLTGVAMRTALELGLSRARPAQARFSPQELARRQMLWWSPLQRAAYCRCVRNEAVDMDWPQTLAESLPAVIWPAHRTSFPPGQDGLLSYKPALHLVALQRIVGDVLECVFIARPVSRPSMSMAETSARVHGLQASLIAWASAIPQPARPHSLEGDMLNLAFHHATLLLHRPSPSFPMPTPEAHAVCLGAARGSIKLFSKITQDGHGTALFSKGTHFLDLFLSGLTLLYCSWAAPASAEAINSLTATQTSLDPDLATCERLLASWTQTHALPPRHISVFRVLVRAFTLIFTGADRAEPSVALALPTSDGWTLDDGGAYGGIRPNDTLAGILRELGVYAEDADMDCGPLALDEDAVEAVRRLLSDGNVPG